MGKIINESTTRTNIFLLILLFISMMLGGCAIGRTANYSYAWPDITYKSNKDITIGIIDKRPYIISGKVKPSYVGLMRGGYGNPFYMYTESGKPLTDDLAEAIVSGFKNAGINTEYVKLRFDMNQNEINNYLISKKLYKKVLIKINEWKSDTYRTTKFLYDLTVTVYDEKGVLLAEHTEKNTNEKSVPVTSSIEEGRRVLSELLNNNSIMNALQYSKKVNLESTEKPIISQASQSPTEHTIEDRMELLNNMNKKGLISQKDYAKKKAEILSEL